jgi:hypothetical protein
MARRRGRFSQALTRARQAVAPRVIIQRVRSRRAARRQAGLPVGRQRATQEGGKLLTALVETGTAEAMGALAGAADGLTLTASEAKALPWLRRGVALSLNYVAEKWGGKGQRLISAAANGIAGADGSSTVGRRATAAKTKSP